MKACVYLGTWRARAARAGTAPTAGTTLAPPVERSRVHGDAEDRPFRPLVPATSPGPPSRVDGPRGRGTRVPGVSAAPTPDPSVPGDDGAPRRPPSLPRRLPLAVPRRRRRPPPASTPRASTGCTRTSPGPTARDVATWSAAARSSPGRSAPDASPRARLPDRRRPHRLPQPPGQAQPRHRGRGLAPAGRRGLRRAPCSTPGSTATSACPGGSRSRAGDAHRGAPPPGRRAAPAGPPAGDPPRPGRERRPPARSPAPPGAGVGHRHAPRRATSPASWPGGSAAPPTTSWRGT